MFEVGDDNSDAAKRTRLDLTPWLHSSEAARHREHQEKIEKLKESYGTDFEGYLAATKDHLADFRTRLTEKERWDPVFVEMTVSAVAYREAYKTFMYDQGGSELTYRGYETILGAIIASRELAEVEAQMQQQN